MTLMFEPALGVRTTLPVPRDGYASFSFKASFSSREACEQARDEGVRVEMWTNLPVGTNEDEWHALAFQCTEDNKSHVKNASASTLNAEAHDQTDASVYLDVPLSDIRVGSTFSFTYRLVYPSGAIQWLGAYGQNGELSIEDFDPRFTLADGWKFGEGDRVEGKPLESAETEVAILNNEMEWTCWAFGKVGWPTFSANASAPPSTMILLAPRKANASQSLLKPDLLIIGVQRDSDYSVRITPAGSVLVRGTSSVTVRTLDSVSATDIFYKYLPETTRYLDCSRDTDFTPVVSRASQDMQFPAALSLIPLSVHGDMTICTEITLRYQDLCRILPELSGSDAVLVNTAAPSFLPLPSHMEDDIVLNVGLAGSQFLLAPLHVLAPPEEESPWKLALLSPYVSALVETVVEVGNASPSLPTPPPSPPLRATPIVSSSSAATSSPPVDYTPSISLPSLQSVGESIQDDQNPDYAPLTPSSPPATLHESLSAEQPVETKEPETRTSTISRRQPPQGGFLRLLFSWLFRAIFARVCGFIDLGFRWWGFPSMLPHIVLASEGKRNLIQEIKTEEPEKVEELEKVEEPVNESVEEDIQADASIQTTTSVSESTLADDSFLSVKEEETNSVHIFEDAPSETTIEILKPIADVAPVITELHMPVSKPRFLADVRSNMVSFLVRTPHSRVSPSDLAIAVDGKPVDGTHPGYNCAALSGNIYLLGLHGPAEGSKLEITLA